MDKFFRIPFAFSGDRVAIPDPTDPNGFVSYNQGYGFDYQRQKTDPASKNIERDAMNGLFYSITRALEELQSQGIPDFITTALNGGSPYSYQQYAVVRDAGQLYISLVAANTALTSDATKWARLPRPDLIQLASYTSAVAGGTADAITAAFAPAILALPAAPGTLSVMVRAGAANTSTTPTFKADGTTAKTIVKGNNLPLAAGDIPGAGYWMHLDYDATLDKWVLQNPGVPFAGFGASLAVNGYQRLPSGVIIQWGSATTSAGGALSVTFPIAFPTTCQAVSVVAGNANHTFTYGSLGAASFTGQCYVGNTGSPAGTTGVKWMAVGT